MNDRTRNTFSASDRATGPAVPGIMESVLLGQSAHAGERPGVRSTAGHAQSSDAEGNK